MANENNLKSWKPGQSGNPDGARKHKGVGKKLKQVTREELKEIVDLILTGNTKKLQAIAESAKKDGKHNQKVLKVWIASVAIKAIMKGDYDSLDRILDRVLGKVKTEVKHEGLPANAPSAVLILPDNGRGPKPTIQAKPSRDGDDDGTPSTA